MEGFIIKKDEKTGHWGCVDADGNLRIPFEYNYLEIKNIGGKKFFEASKESRLYVFELNGKPIIPVEYECKCVCGFYTKEKALYIVSKDEGRFFGVIDSNGETIIDLKYDGVIGYNENNEKLFFVVVNKDGKIGVMDKNGKEILPNEYDDMDYLMKISNGTNVYGLLVQKNNKWGLCDLNGKFIVEMEYDWMVKIPDEFLIEVEKNNKFGIINKNGEIVLHCVYNHIEYGLKNKELAFFLVKDDNYWILFDKNGEKIYSSRWSKGSQLKSSGKRYFEIENDKIGYNFYEEF